MERGCAVFRRTAARQHGGLLLMATPQFTVPVLAYVGLQSQTTNAEIAGKGYTRRPATFDYMADKQEIANVATIQWTVATAPWGVINTVLVFDLPTAGTLLA